MLNTLITFAISSMVYSGLVLLIGLLSFLIMIERGNALG